MLAISLQSLRDLFQAISNAAWRMRLPELETICWFALVGACAMLVVMWLRAQRG